MKTERHKFKPEGSNDYTAPYEVSVSEYNDPILCKGFMLQMHTRDASMTYHSVSAEDLRKLAFMFNAMAENAERTNNPA